MSNKYNGWRNYETWNVALWLFNDEHLYHAAREAKIYPELLLTLREFNSFVTGDGVRWDDPKVDRAEIMNALHE